jgi:hypothetical protein
MSLCGQELVFVWALCGHKTRWSGTVVKNSWLFGRCAGIELAGPLHLPVYLVAKALEFAVNPAVASAWILLGHPQNVVPDHVGLFGLRSRASVGAAVVLPRDKHAMPFQDRVRRE